MFTFSNERNANIDIECPKILSPLTRSYCDMFHIGG